MRKVAKPATPKANLVLTRGMQGLALAGLLGALGGPARAEDWSSLGLSQTRGRSSAELAGGRFDGGVWRHEWKSEPALAHRALVATPAIADGFVAFASQRNTVRVLSETDGRLLWEAKRGGAVVASPAIWRGLVFVAGVNQRLVALNLVDGSLVWERQLGALAYASPVVVGDSLFLATASPAPRVWRLDPATGNVAWQAGEGTMEASALGSVAVAEGHVLVGELGGRYHSFALGDGAHQWTAETGGRGGLSSPLVFNGRAYLLPGGDTARLHAVDLATGAAVAGWPIDLPMPAAESTNGPAKARRYLASSPAGGAGGITFALRADDRFGAALTGEATSVVCQEQLFLVNPADGKVLWSVGNGRLGADDPNDVPTHELLPTPALYHSASGELLVAASSSVSPRVRVFAANGDERWSAQLTAPTRGSPLVANGRLLVATDAGVVESFLSGSNGPPAPPAALGPAADSQAVATTLHWGLAADPEEQAVSYVVRLDDDGEVLRDWDQELTFPAGTQSVALPPLSVGGHVFAVRARDPQGALSPWSSAQAFRATASPEVTVDDQPSASLDAAVAAAPSGSIIRLGAGRFDLTRTLRLPPGVALMGAGPHLTTLNAQGLPVGVAPGSGSELRGLTVSGGQIGVGVDATNVHLRNVILRDNGEAGLDVVAAGSAELVSATLVRNGVAVRAAGATLVRNALVTNNTVGLLASAPGALTSAYNDVHLNQGENYRGLGPSATDLALAVSFPSDDDLRLPAAQLTTDRGDPADEFTHEPAPNGARINLGAFGNTEFAELSPTTGTEPGNGGASGSGGASGGGASSGGTGGVPAPAPTPVATSAKPRSGGCSYAGGGHGGLVPLSPLLGVLLRRRRRSRPGA